MRPFRESHPLSGKNKYYRPPATRTETLVTLLIITLLLIALLEYSCHVIPQHSGFGSTAEELVNVTRSNAEPSESPAISPSQSTSFAPMASSIEFIPDNTILTAAGSSYPSPKIPTTIPEPTLPRATYLTPSTTTATSYQATYLTPGTGGTFASAVSIPYLTTNIDISTPVGPPAPAATNGRHLTPGPTISLPTEEYTYSTSAPGMIIPSSKMTTPSPIVVPITSDYVSTITVSEPTITNTGPTPIVVPITSDYISTITVSNPATENKVPSPTDPENKVTTLSFTSNQQVPDSTFVEVITFKSFSRNSDGNYVELTTITSSSLLRAVSSTSNRSQNEPTASDPAIAPTETNPTDSSILIVVSTFKSVYQSTIFPTSSNTIINKPIATSANSSGTFIYHSNGSVTAPDQITYRQYLIASFLPLFLAIFYAIPWRVLENTVRYMEPFYQLRPFSHSTESKAIHLDYESPLIFIIPFSSISRKHFTVFVTSLISIIMLVVAPLASQVMVVVESNYCVGTGLTICDSWGIYPNIARVLEGLLGSVALFVLFLMIAGLRRNTGVYSEPLSLVGLAVMYRETPLSFQAINDGQASQKEGRSHIPVQGYTSLLTVKTDMARKTPDSALLRSKRRDGSKKTFLSKVWNGIKIRLIHLGGLCLLCGILSVVAVYYQTDANTGFNRFMNSQGFGVRFLMTALGTGTNLLWSRIDEDLRKMDPYHQLLRGNAKPQNSILPSVHMSPYTALIPSLRRKHYLVSWISFCSILSEFLPITLANIPYSNTETRLVLLTCFYLAMGILSLMIIGVVILLFRPRHYVKSLPRKPCTIAARLEYLAPAGEVDDSNLLRSVDGLALLEREDRDARVIARGKLYSMGIGEDGKLRIDEDERIVGKWGKEKRHGAGV
ncbi:hypothetical protein EAF04_002071 [Stromatinia cepivora]|nr:hypothetical protein EAF04_002071 [Stromatinia cepivora]